jgi:Rrf2 family protein
MYVSEPTKCRLRQNGGVRISAKADYAVRAALELAAADDPPVKGERIAESQSIPLKFLENILGDLRQAGLVVSQRGPVGGYRLERPADEISVADIIRAVDGPLASVRGERPESMHYAGPADHLAPVWIALRASVRGVLEHVTLQDIVSGKIPPEIDELAKDPDAARRR